MDSVFISWGSPDAQIVQPVITRLRQFGLGVHEYGANMLPGADIQTWIRGTIDSSKVAIVFLSADTAGREWLNTEVAWCFAAAANTGLHIVPVLIDIPPLIDNVPNDKIPHLLRSGTLRMFAFSTGIAFEKSLLTLVDQVHELMNSEAPAVVMAALLAMTEAQSNKILPNPAQMKLSPICQKMGMGEFSDSVLKERYGPKAEDFSPFPGGKLIDQIHKSLEAANNSRRKNGRPPVWLRWCTSELLSEDYKIRKEARDMWEINPSLLVVDSISLLEPSFKAFLRQPPTGNPSSSAMLWLPPYTRHTAGIESMIEESLQALGQVLDPGNVAFLDPVLDKFRKWGDKNEPYIAFDIGTSATLRRWLYSAFGELEVKLQPDDASANIMRNTFGTNVTTKSFFRMGPQ